MSEKVYDGSDLPFLSRRHNAAREIAETERLRTAGHEAATLLETANLACIEMNG